MRTSPRPEHPHRRPLPPLDHVLAFEAAASLGSFAGAARQMHLSETAISRKVRLLEAHFGTAFFARGHRSVALTAQGQAFLAQVSPAIAMLRAAADAAFDAARDRPVVLAATQSVAALWLTPRLPAFHAAHRDLRIMLVASDNDAECLAPTVDLAIMRGEGAWPGFDSIKLFGESVFPVCSPDFLARNPGLVDVAALASAPLIEVASSHAEWMNWRGWLGGVGARPQPLQRPMLFNAYPLAIQAAAEGAGVALGWAHLVDDLLAAGRLVRPFGALQVSTRAGYFLLTAQDRRVSAAAHQVRDWLLGLGGAEPPQTGQR